MQRQLLSRLWTFGTRARMDIMIDLSRRRISPKELRSRGWTALPRPDNHPASKQYRHAEGWRIEHCGHPTALWPYALFDPAGRMICTGAAFGNPPDFGTAWPSVASAVDFVATQVGVL